MHSILYVNVFLVLVTYSKCNSSESSDGMIKVENFYPPEGFQPVQGFEPPNYKPYKKIQEALALNNRPSASLSSPSKDYKGPNQFKNTNGANKFIDRQTNIEIYDREYKQHQNYLSMDSMHSPFEHSIGNTFNYQQHKNINEYQNQLPSNNFNFPNQNVPSFNAQSTTTSTNKPFFVNNNNNNNNKAVDGEPFFATELETPHQLESAFDPPVLPPHMSPSYNLNEFDSQIQIVENGVYNFNSDNMKSEGQSFDNWNKNMVAGPTTTKKNANNMDPNWRRTPPPNKYFWTTPPSQNVPDTFPVQNFWTKPTNDPFRPTLPVQNMWPTQPPPTFMPPQPSTSSSSSSPAFPQYPPQFWTQPPPPPPIYHTQSSTTSTTPSTTASTAAPIVDYKELFMHNKRNNSAASGSNNANKYNINQPIELTIDNDCMKCLCFIESWCSDVNCVWDQGSLSCGWYQLKHEYWLDCGQPGGSWKDCANNKRCAEGCVRGYMKRYRGFCSVGQSCPDLARIHNGGPYGCSANSTEYYGWLIGRCLRREPPYENIDLIYKNLLETNKISH